MFDKKNIKVSKELYQDIEFYIQDMDFENVSDFIEDYLSKEIRPKIEEKKVEGRLKGLGYIE